MSWPRNTLQSSCAPLRRCLSQTMALLAADGASHQDIQLLQTTPGSAFRGRRQRQRIWEPTHMLQRWTPTSCASAARAGASGAFRRLCSEPCSSDAGVGDTSMTTPNPPTRSQIFAFSSYRRPVRSPTRASVMTRTTRALLGSADGGHKEQDAQGSSMIVTSPHLEHITLRPASTDPCPAPRSTLALTLCSVATLAHPDPDLNPISSLIPISNTRCNPNLNPQL